MPLVHRTGRPGSSAWRAIFGTAEIRAGDAATQAEIDLGYPRAVYFFLGAGAYPRGNVAFLLASDHAATRPCTFTPFDTGAVVGGHAVTARGAPLAAEEARTTIAAYLGAGADLQSFAEAYLAAHFLDPAEYAARPQTSNPDFPAYHGLESKTGDRRAWTIEVRAHEDVAVLPDAPHLLRIVVADKDLRRELPTPYLSRCSVAAPTDVFEAVAGHVRAAVEAHG